MNPITVQELAEAVDNFVKNRDWEKYHKPKEVAMALSIEASELLEIFLWKLADRDLSDDELKRVKLETADIAIYALSLANACGFDLGKAVLEKIALNEEKYPVEGSKNQFD